MPKVEALFTAALTCTVADALTQGFISLLPGCPCLVIMGQAPGVLWTWSSCELFYWVPGQAP